MLLEEVSSMVIIGVEDLHGATGVPPVGDRLEQIHFIRVDGGEGSSQPFTELHKGIIN